MAIIIIVALGPLFCYIGSGGSQVLNKKLNWHSLILSNLIMIPIIIIIIGECPAEPQYINLTVLFCNHKKQFHNAIVTVAWSPPKNEELVPLSFYHVTIFGNKYNQSSSIRAEPGQNATHTAVFPAEGSYNASIVAESECGVKSKSATVPDDQNNKVIIVCLASINKLHFMSVILNLFIYTALVRI